QLLRQQHLRPRGTAGRNSSIAFPRAAIRRAHIGQHRIHVRLPCRASQSGLMYDLIMSLKQASVAQVKKSDIPRADAHIVITMRFYPRFLKKELRDDFSCELAPTKELLHDFNAAQEKLGNHNLAFDESNYENRFELSAKGLELLKSYSQ